MPPLFADPSKTRRSTLAVLLRLWAHMGRHKKIYIAGTLPSREKDPLIGKDPLLVNPAGNDFTLQAGSPAKGKGHTACR